jgi:hypothetical protein
MAGDKVHQRRAERKDQHKPEPERDTAPARYPAQGSGEVRRLLELIRRRECCTGSGKRLPNLRQIVSRDRKPDLPVAVLSGDDYPVPVDDPGRRPTERNGRIASRERVLAQRLGRGDHEGVRADGQPLRAAQGNPHAAGAPESSGAEDAGALEGSSKGHLRLYFAAQRSVPVAFTVSPDEEVHDYARDCQGNDELHNHGHEFCDLICIRLDSVLLGLGKR